MKRLLLAIGLALLVGSGPALASTHSDYTKSFPLKTLKTFAFKEQRRISRDPLADSAIWATNVKDGSVAISPRHGRGHLRQSGLLRRVLRWPAGSL